MYTYSQLIPLILCILLSMVKAVFEDLSNGMKHCLSVAVLDLQAKVKGKLGLGLGYKLHMHITNVQGADVFGS